MGIKGNDFAHVGGSIDSQNALDPPRRVLFDTDQALGAHRPRLRADGAIEHIDALNVLGMRIRVLVPHSYMSRVHLPVAA